MNSSTSKLVVKAVCLGVCLLGAATASSADEPPSRKRPDARTKPDGSASKTGGVRLSDDQIRNALEFAEQHHPELATLLTNLRRKSSAEFRRGIRDVHLTTTRLDRLKEKQPARFDRELLQWKTDSEFRLLSAKWIVSGSRKLELKIRTMLRKRQENRLQRLQSERDRLAAKLEQIDKQINMDSAGRDAILQAEWEKLARRAAVARKPRKPATQKKSTGSKEDATKNKS